MSEKEFEEIIRRKELGIRILSIVYLVLIIAIYFSISLYLSNVSEDDMRVHQSIVVLIITGVIGTYSKNLYISLVGMVFNDEERFFTEKIKQEKMRVEGIVNYLTILLLVAFLTNFTDHDIYLKIAIACISALTLLIIIAIYFKFDPFEKDEKISKGNEDHDYKE